MTDRSTLGLVGAATAASGGLWTLLVGLTDPSFLLARTDFWYPIALAVGRFIGPMVLPAIPWNLLTLVAALVFVAAALIKEHRRQSDL